MFFKNMGVVMEKTGIWIKRNGIIHLMFAYIFFTSGLITNFFQFLLYVFLRPFSKYWQRKLNCCLLSLFHAQILFMGEWWGQIETHLYIENRDETEKYLGKENALVILNHAYHLDWLVGFKLMNKYGMLGKMKAFAKNTIQYVPLIGWGWKFSDFIFLKRSYKKDEVGIKKQLNELMHHPEPIWISLFPEGTRLTPKKLIESQKYAAEHGLPVFKNHICPRTKGFSLSVQAMDKVDGIYDITIVFKPEDNLRTNFRTVLNGEKIKCCMILKRIPFEEVPKEHEKASKFIYDMFIRKDRLIESYNKTGDLFIESGVDRVESEIMENAYYTLLMAIIWSTITTLPIIILITYLLINSYYYACIAIFVIFIIIYICFRTMIDVTKQGKRKEKPPTFKKKTIGMNIV